MKTEIYYFTGTGNSLYVAQELNKALVHSGDLHPVARYQNDEAVYSDAEMVGFVFPVYMGSVPWIVAEFIKKLRLEKPSYIFAVATYNSHAMQCMEILSELLRSNSMNLALAETVVMPGNAKANSPQESESKLNASARRIIDISQKINDKAIEPLAASPKTAKDALKAFKHTSIARFKVLPSCNGCGLCSKICPVKNIEMDAGKPVWGKDCASCLACFHWCPENSIKWTLPVIGNRSQYHHPEISVQDIIGSLIEKKQ
jgi:ferredoxin